jgi:hypothetical protein
MSECLFCLSIIAASAITSALVGRGLLVAVRARWLLRPRLENLFVWVFAGVGWWVLGFGWLSYGGLTARQARWPLLAGGAAWGALGLWRGRAWLGALGRSLRAAPGGPGVFFAACLLSLVGLLHRVQNYEWASMYNDTLTYVSLSTWLQDHGFDLAGVPYDRQYYITHAPHFFIAGGHRMGATWLLALLQALTGREALSVSNPLMGFGLLLNLAGVYLFARWAVRLGWKPAAGAVLFAASLGSPLQTAEFLGFQAQMYGTAFFPVILALLARCLAPRRWAPGGGLALALVTTTFLSAYHDMAPLLVPAVLGTLVLTFRRARRAGLTRRFAFFALVTFAGLLALGNIEWLRSARSLSSLVGTFAGWPIPWDGPQYLQFALGVAPGAYPLDPAAWSDPDLLLVFGLALAGVVALVRRRRWVALEGLSLFLVLAVYFHFVRDPFTAERGHRWSLFKLAKWAYPLVAVLPFAGLAWLRPRLSLPRLVFFVPGAAMVFLCLIRFEARECGPMTSTLGAHPQGASVRLREYVKAGGFQSVYLVDWALNPGEKRPGLAGYLFHPLPSLNGASPREEDDPAIDLGGNTLAVTWLTPPFEPPAERLPLNLNRLDVSRPHVASFTNPAGWPPPHPAGGVWLPLSDEPATLRLWAPRRGKGRLVLRFAPADDNPAGWNVRLRGKRNGVDRDLVLRSASRVELPLLLPPGRSSVELVCRPLGKARKVLTLRHAEVRFDESPHQHGITRR